MGSPLFLHQRARYGLLDRYHIFRSRVHPVLAVIGGGLAHLYRLGAVVLLALSALLAANPAFASFPPVAGVQYLPRGGFTEVEYPVSAARATRELACIESLVGAVVVWRDSSYSMEGDLCVIKRAAPGSTPGYYRFIPREIASDPSCPVNSTLISGLSLCSCNSGFEQSGNTCVPQKDSKCGALEGQFLGITETGASFGVRSSNWMKNKVGTAGTTCFPGGCQISGKVTGCAGGGSGGTYCSLASPSFNGKSCVEEKPDESICPKGYIESTYVPGVCIPSPEENPCQAGYVKSEYVKDLCIPAADDGKNPDPDSGNNGDQGKPSKCGEGRCESNYVQGLCIPCDQSVTADKDGEGKTSCDTKTQTCTTVKGDGTTDSQDKKTFCQENKDSPACKESNWGGGSCSAGFSCEGDAVQCAMAKEQHKLNCKLYEPDSDANGLTNKALNGTDEDSAFSLQGKAEKLTVDKFDDSGFGWSHSCPADPSFPLNFGGRSAELTIPFSRICGPLGILSMAGVGITLLGAMLWVLGGKKD